MQTAAFPVEESLASTPPTDSKKRNVRFPQEDSNLILVIILGRKL